MDAQQKAEPKKKYPAEGKNLPGTGEQYLLALIKCADWVSEPYKQLAEKHRADTEFLKELYLCACEGIPIERTVEVQGASNPQMALKTVRHSYLETDTDEYKEEMSGLKGMAAVLEKEVRQMSGVLRHIADNIPNFDSLFPEEEPLPFDSSPMELPLLEKQQKPSKAVAEDFKTLKEAKNRWFSRAKKRETAGFVEGLLEAGYSTEQLEYILDCMEEGLSVKEIQRFISPKLPAKVMRRLRLLEEKK